MIKANIIPNRYLTEEEIEQEGRILSDGELIQELSTRGDIYTVEETSVVKRCFIISYTVGILLLIYISALDLRTFSVAPFFFSSTYEQPINLGYANVEVTKKGDDIAYVSIKAPDDGRPRKVYYFLGDGTHIYDGERSKEAAKRDVTETIRRMLIPLRIAYHKHANRDFTHSGKIVVKWAIDEWGYVVDARIVESTMGDYTFENTILKQVKGWYFGKSEASGDITEVTYPFEFVKPGMDRYEVSAL